MLRQRLTVGNPVRMMHIFTTGILLVPLFGLTEWSYPTACNISAPGEQKVALDYGEGSLGYYGIPKDFTMPNLTAVTMCAWVKHSSIQLQGGNSTFYLSYRKNMGTPPLMFYTNDLLAFYTGKTENELHGVIIGGKVEADPVNDKTVYDSLWHSVCSSWRSSDGTYIRGYDNNIESKSEEFQKYYTIPGGGELVVCQRWDEGGFRDDKYCYGEIGAVELWDYYMDFRDICCVNNCWSVGNLFHFNWTEMVVSGRLSELNKAYSICGGEVTPVAVNTHTCPEGRSNTVLYVVSGVQGAVNLLLIIFMGYKFR